MLRDLDRLHASAEAHGRVCLCQTTDHAARDTGNEVRGAVALGVELGFGGDEEEDGALGGCLDPGPGDETLVDCRARKLAIVLPKRCRWLESLKLVQFIE